MVHPPNSGAKVVLYNRIVELSKYFRVTFCCLREEDEDLAAAAHLESFCEVVLVDEAIGALRTSTLLREPSAMEFSPKLTAWLDNPTVRALLQRSFDVVEIHSSCWFRSEIENPAGRTVLVALNDEREYFLARAAAAWRLDGLRAGMRAALDALLVTQQERRAIRASDAVVSLAPVDGAARARFGDRPALHNWGGVDCAYYAAADEPSSPADAPTLVCVAAFFVEAAVEGAREFIEKALPAIRAEVPGTRLVLVGDHRGNTTIARLARDYEYVEATGLVPDVRPYLGAADIAITPLNRGSGIRYKIMEALAAGKPVVSTEKGAEGLGLEASVDALLSPDIPGMVPLIVRLLQDATLRGAFARRSREVALERFDRVREHRKLADWYADLLAQDSSQ